MRTKTFPLSCIRSLFVLLAVCCLVACGGDDAPVARMPELSIKATPDGVTSTQVTLEGYIQTNGTHIASCGFLVNSQKAVLEKTGIDQSSAHSATLGSDGTVKLQVSSLTPSTTYYFCLYATSGSTPLKSSIGSFTTTAIAEPSFSNVQLVAAGETELTVKCQVTNTGGQAMQTFGFEYKRSNEQAFKYVSVDKFDGGSTDNTFTAIITGLEPGAVYHVRASGSNGSKSGKSEQTTFSTTAKASPTVSIGDIPDGNIGINYVTASAKIEDTGASTITERGFLIGTVSNPLVGTDGVVKVDVQVATNDFSATIENLAPATTYYIRAFAANNPYGSKTQYGYSEVKEITTKPFIAPSFGEITEQLVGVLLKVSCSVNNNGVNILEKGFCYSKINRKPEVDNTDNTIKVEGAMEATFPIEENTTYYIRAYVKYNLTGKEETQYSETLTSRKHTFARPFFTETSSSDVSYTSAKLKAVLVDNGVTITERGFLWGKTDKPETTLLVTGDEFEVILSDLQPGTSYYFQPYVKITLAGKSETIKEGTVAKFTTWNPIPSQGDNPHPGKE